ncbi:MAG: four helix bundle protein [Patescibacteria group bacterium]|nr:four helix bundle protein [Patescibacteria group bacterium]
MSDSLVDIPLVHALYDTYACWHQLALKFPKSQRYTLGRRCDDYMLSVLELVLEAATAGEPKKKESAIVAASAKLDTLKLLVRLSKDCKCISHRHYQAMETRLYRIGRMTGGWLKSMR